MRDDQGAVVASLLATRPCRATIGATELIVGGPPLVAQNGEIKWTSADRGNGTTLLRDGVAVARVLDRDGITSVFDPQGIPLAKLQHSGRALTVADPASRVVRHVAAAGENALSIDHPAMTVVGTNDLALAALLSAPELPAEVRMLAACERVLAPAGGS